MASSDWIEVVLGAAGLLNWNILFKCARWHSYVDEIWLVTKEKEEKNIFLNGCPQQHTHPKSVPGRVEFEKMAPDLGAMCQSIAICLLPPKFSIGIEIDANVWGKSSLYLVRETKNNVLFFYKIFHEKALFFSQNSTLSSSVMIWNCQNVFWILACSIWINYRIVMEHYKTHAFGCTSILKFRTIFCTSAWSKIGLNV